ncbi:multidrug effflux MFS transporter [Bradyrhizobium zhanjiangense]
MGFLEFVVVIAFLMALSPLAMDMMLPALPNIRFGFQIADGNRPQMVLSVFMIGLGVAQFIMGPLSDRFGRRPVLLGGMIVYCIAGLLAIMAPSFEWLLLSRAMQGLSAAATRVITISIIRDCYAGREMARVTSLAMMVFVALPLIAPSIGQVVMLLTHWRGIFVLLMLYGVIVLAWSAMRMPETLSKEMRRSVALPQVLSAFRQTITNRQTLGYALAAGGVQGSQFAFVFCSQQIFTEIFKLGHYFPVAFAACTVGMPMAGFLNSRIVGRIGTRVILHAALTSFALIAAVLVVAVVKQIPSLPICIVLLSLMMFVFGLMTANFTALAMEPQGKIAGTASSLYGTITTLLGIGIGTTIGQFYDGSLLPFATGFFLCTLAALAVVLVTEKGRMFRPDRGGAE